MRFRERPHHEQGVDISPLVWVAILSFFSEILVGPQGLLSIMQKKGM